MDMDESKKITPEELGKQVGEFFSGLIRGVQAGNVTAADMDERLSEAVTKAKDELDSFSLSEADTAIPTETDDLRQRVNEIKEHAGLTWSEVGALFKVSRHSAWVWGNSGRPGKGHADSVVELSNRVRGLVADGAEQDDVRESLFG